MTLCFATNNEHKLNEVSGILKTGIEIISLRDIGCTEEIPEDFMTVRENSLAKAEYISSRYHIDCFTDDTGLEVDALYGQPGVRSARFAGPGKNSTDNVNLLLKLLGTRADRSARFRTVITLILQESVHQFEGVVEGSITMSARGANGFGYDPVFQPLGHELTFAGMPADQKNRISHRAIAVSKLAAFLNSWNENHPAA